MSRNSNSIGSTRKRKLYVALRRRHGDTCHWCGKAMCFKTKLEPFSASIEHLIPRSEGGTDEQINLRLAHKRCNEDRSIPTPRRCRSPFNILAVIL